MNLLGIEHGGWLNHGLIKRESGQLYHPHSIELFGIGNCHKGTLAKRRWYARSSQQVFPVPKDMWKIKEFKRSSKWK